MDELIFVVDDDDANRLVTHEVLTDAGFRVVTLASADELRDAMARERPALVILDGGITAAARAHVLPSTPVIVLSAAYGREIERYASEIGARAWLRKPYEVDELVEMVREQADRDGR